jgi:hypothetical protein
MRVSTLLFTLSLSKGEERPKGEMVRWTILSDERREPKASGRMRMVQA